MRGGLLPRAEAAVGEIRLVFRWEHCGKAQNSKRELIDSREHGFDDVVFATRWPVEGLSTFEDVFIYESGLDRSVPFALTAY